MKEINESGVVTRLEDNHENPSDAKTFYNPVMKICRELVLAAVAAHVQGCHSSTHAIRCLDAFGATGVTGLQWKQRLGAAVHVFINELDPVSAQSILANCARNDIHVTQFHEHGLDRHQGEPGVYHEDQKSVEVVQDDANVTMHRQQFHIVHLDPFGSTVQYLDALFRNIYHGGLAILTATDVAALYGKCPAVTARNYSAYTRNTDYTKELAVRILLAEAARAAAKCNKGFEVLYSVGVEHFLQVGLRIKRGAKHGNQAAAAIQQYLHCVHCAEWAPLPHSHNPTEEPYKYLPCSCREQNPGHTAFILGPMWSGNIMSREFIGQMQAQVGQLELSKRAGNILSLLAEESVCACQPAHNTRHPGTRQHAHPRDTTSESRDGDRANQSGSKPVCGENSCGQTSEHRTATNDSGAKKGDGHIVTGFESNVVVEDDNIESSCLLSHDNATESSNVVVSANKKEISANKNHSVTFDPKDVSDQAHSSCQMDEAHGSKRKGDSAVRAGAVKRRKTCRHYSEDQIPKFYYNLHKRQIKNVNIPRLISYRQYLHSLCPPE